MSDAEKKLQQVQSLYYQDEQATSESASEYVSARSPDTWKSTSISGVDDWCSIASEGTTLDDFKSLDDDLAEEYFSDDNVEDLPLNGQATNAATSKQTIPTSPAKEYAAVTGIQESRSKKYTSTVQPTSTGQPLSSDVGMTIPKTVSSSVPDAPGAFFPGKATTSEQLSFPRKDKDEMAVAVSPKSSTAFEPAKYSSVITKTEATEVKSEVKKSYEIQTQIKAGGVQKTFTSQNVEDIQMPKSTAPSSSTERIHKITLVDDAQRGFPKMSQAEEFPKNTPLSSYTSQTKTELLSEIEGLKSKYCRNVPDQDKSSKISKENKSESFSYGVSSLPSSGQSGDKDRRDTSKVVYSKEVTETHSSTSFSIQQQSFGINRTEKWQSVTPQLQLPSAQTTVEAETQDGNERITKLEQEMKESKEWIQLKIQEMYPAMTDIGSNLQEVTDLYQQHEKVLEKLQTKQSPVEELLRQADDLISTQKPRGEVYSAMAENLGLAWKDLNAQLEQRRQILEQAVAFFSKANLFADSLEVIKKSVSETFLPNTVESTTAILNRHKEERKSALSYSMRMMSEGQLLLERLCEVATHSMGDSRPLHMQHAARNTASFVERYMEALQDRWRHLESLWNQKKTQLEQCLLKCQLELQLSEGENWLRTRGMQFTSNRNLGDSLANSEIILHEHQKIEKDLKEKQEYFLKLVKTAEELQRKGNYAGEELRSRAYLLLSECTELVTALEQRRQLLADSVNFFTEAQTAQTKLDQIDIQLSTSDSPVSPSTVEEAASSAIQMGRQILGSVGMTEPGAQGIARKVEELERKMRKLADVCKAKESMASEKNQAFRKFCQQYDELAKWLSNNGQFFIQRARDMGSTQTSAKAFLDQHESLQHDLRMKGMEMDALLRTVPNLVRSGGEEAEVVHSKSENLKQQWSELRTILEKRILIAQRYLAFLKLANKVSKEMEELEEIVKHAVEVPEQSKFRNIEERQLALRQELLQLNNNGKNFLADAHKVDDMFLNMSLPCSTVEDILSRLELRSVSLNTQWLNLQNEISATKQTLIQWEQLIKESNKVIKSSQEIEHKMFPVIPHELYKVESILPFLENRTSDVLLQIKAVQKEVENCLKKCEVSKSKDGSQKEHTDLLNKLKDTNQLLQKRLTDYQILVSMMTTFFKNYEELEKLVEMQESQFGLTSLPNDVSKMEVLIHDHEASRPTVLELFKFSHTEAQQTINKINEAEPPTAAAIDRDKISSFLSSRKQVFERSWEEFKHRLEQHNQLCIFFRDMHQINKQIEDLNFQLTSIRESYGESLPSALHTSEAFLQFEKTLEILQIRIYEFVSTAERLMRDQRVDSTQVHYEIDSMQKKWSTFRTEVTNNRRLIDVAIEYYKIIEESEEWLKEGSSLLISIARKSSTCTKESDADNLKKEIHYYLDKGRSKQEERLKKISSLSQQLYGHQPHPSMNIINNKNKDMMDSFSVITSELNTLSSNIKVAQQAKIVEQKGKKEMDAVLHAAQAEAEAAREAAATALQAAKLAEAAAKTIPPKPIEPLQRPPRFTRLLNDAEVPEGIKFTFECEVEGFPIPQVQWFKDGILVENNPDYQTTFENGVCKLTIEETFSEDTAKFICRATNSAGVAETQSQLVVKESRAQNELIPPHFVQEPLDSVVAEGEPHQLECQVFGNPLPLVSWFKDDICIDYSTEYAITYNNGYCTLRIEEAIPDHQGRYTCRAVNQVGQVACSANIQVQSTTPSERPIFISPLSNVMARAGQKLRLECSVSGQPQPQVTWLHNSKSIKETRDTKLHFDGSNATLVITEAFPKDAGTYTIIARNKAGETVSSCNVSVKGRLPLETSDSEIASDIEPAKPQVKQQLEDQTVFEGKKVRMDCVIVGQPEPEVIWYHNGKPVKESDDFQLLFEGDRCTLIIEVAYLEDAGTYKCVAINSGGEASSICQLTVKPVDIIQKSQFSQKDILLTVEKCEPPKFLKLLDNISVVEGEDFTLECHVVGETGTTVTWFKDGSQVLNSPEQQIVSEDSGITRLIVPACKLSDRGTYSVKAQNKVGYAQSICSVFVTPSGPIVFGQTPLEVPPMFLQHIESYILPIGSTARFETTVDGSPKPKVRWNYKGKPVPKDAHHDVGSDEDKKHWLIIKDIQSCHAGRYSAIAENNSGIATTSALLSLEDFSASEPPVVEEQMAQSMIMTKKKTILQTSTISSVSELSDVDYQLPEVPSFSTLQSQQLVKMEQSSIVQQPPSQPVSSFVPTFEPTVIKKAPTVVDTHVSSITEIKPNYMPPKFIKPVSTEIVTVGEKLLLEAYYEGVPEPTIEWLKDDVEIKNKPGLQISTIGNKTSVFVLKSSESDSGRYSCIATNVSGKATSIADVKVKPLREAPKFKKKFEASVVRSGSKVTFEIEVTGIPVPEVQWYRNGTPLRDSPDFRISSAGLKHALLISEVFPDDSGTFMVVASNVAGEARCVADLIVEEEKSPEEEKSITYEAFSSFSQTKQMYTKMSASQPITIESYPAPSDIKTVEVPIKVPSPPPIPAVCAKVWNQNKPTPFPAPAITEAPEPVPIPSPEPEETDLKPMVQPSEVVEEVADVPKDFSEAIIKSASQNIIQDDRSGYPIMSSMSESFVKKSVMKFSQPDVKQQPLSEVTTFKSPLKDSSQKPVQNGFDLEFKPSSSVSQSTFVSESRSFMSSGTVSSTQNSNVPIPTFVPKSTITFQSGKDTMQSRVPVWQPKKIPELKSPPQKNLPPAANELITENYSTKNIPPHVSENKSTSCDLKSSTSTTSCQTLTTPSLYDSESSTTTRTSSSTRTEEISIVKKYELVLEHSSETIVSSEEDNKIMPKPIIKKDVKDGPKVKKEVVIEEEPVLGAEVKPPLFAKVRGAESLRKIHTDV